MTISWVVRVALVGAVTLSGCGGKLSTTFSIPEAEIQRAVNEPFPLSSAEMVDAPLPLVVTLSEPRVILREGSDKIGLESTLAVEPRSQPTESSPVVPKPPLPPPVGPLRDRRAGPLGHRAHADDAPPRIEPRRVTVYVRLRYDTQQGAIFASDPSIAPDQLEHLPERFREPAARVVERVLGKILEKLPLSPPNEDFATRAAKAVTKSVTVRDGKLLVEIGL